jgi:hypothetical protein
MLHGMADRIRVEHAYPPPADAPIDLGGIAAVADFEAPSRARLDPAAWAYDAGGGRAGGTIRDNVEARRRFRDRPRVLVCGPAAR